MHAKQQKFSIGYSIAIVVALLLIQAVLAAGTRAGTGIRSAFEQIFWDTPMSSNLEHPAPPSSLVLVARHRYD